MKTIRVLSLGAGVQSTTVLMLALTGEIEPIDAAIFADTGWEPAAVYRHLEWCREQCELAGVPLHTVERSSLKDDTAGVISAMKRGEKGGMAATLQIPVYHRASPAASVSMLKRYCTSNYKVHPVNRQINALRREHKAEHGEKPLVQVLIGISLDEIQRMKVARWPWMEYVHPLAWDLRWTRLHCIEWMKARGYMEPPRSACITCPYRSNREWRDIRSDPADWAEAIALDREIRDAEPGRPGHLYVHRSGVPLEEAQIDEETPPLFGWIEECEGMCGM